MASTGQQAFEMEAVMALLALPKDAGTGPGEGARMAVVVQLLTLAGKQVARAASFAMTEGLAACSAVVAALVPEA